MPAQQIGMTSYQSSMCVGNTFFVHAIAHVGVSNFISTAMQATASQTPTLLQRTDPVVHVDPAAPVPQEHYDEHTQCQRRELRRHSHRIPSTVKDEQRKQEDIVRGPATRKTVEGRVWKLSRDSQGCRRIQKLIQDVETDDERMAIVDELKGHVWDAMFCSHANHVLQLVISSMRASSCRFIIQEILQRGAGAVCKAARNVYACRVLQRLLEFCAEQADEVVNHLLSEGTLLCRHVYGNFVMQHVLEYGSDFHRGELVLEMEKHAMALGFDFRASAPLAKALAHSEEEQRASLARALLKESRLISTMARTRHGHLVVLAMLEMCSEDDRRTAEKQIKEERHQLRSSRYGRLVLSFVACVQETRV